ncbi:uncharacterized protein LOC129758470 isoform X3 [Uranotaenia lowii]|uniref:uncharacterized protein LOC129758470 isoform X3 n=1 Tax=Uranotaenia lowii TaxID=190385 RepID=UPI00247A9725|nr:uncharacterized protein LOC129758470 isoform X3 [Uranotaenia lowii]
MFAILVLLSVVLTNFCCCSIPLFGVGSMPLMESSLEQTMDTGGRHRPAASHSSDQLSIEERDSADYSDSSRENKSLIDSVETDEEDGERIYDLMIKILHILDKQARRDTERARRLHNLKNSSSPVVNLVDAEFLSSDDPEPSGNLADSD